MPPKSATPTNTLIMIMSQASISLIKRLQVLLEENQKLKTESK